MDLKRGRSPHPTSFAGHLLPGEDGALTVARGGRTLIPVGNEADAVNFAILKAHRLGEPRVLELPRARLLRLRSVAPGTDWSSPSTYRGLRVAEREGSAGRVLAWDRAREMEVAQRIDWGVRMRRD